MIKLKQIGNVGGDVHIDPNKETTYVGVGIVSAQKGITLVALVITIIILLILAGITISLTVGQKGILTRAQEAGRNYQESEKREDEELTNFSKEADNIIAGINIPNSSSGDNYTMVDGIPVPKGFEHLDGTTKEDGFVIKDISTDSEGKPTITNGNEFVWIPCGATEQKDENGVITTIKYDRYAFSRDGWENAQTKNEATGEITRNGSSYVYTEAMPTIELNSIKKYGGFYIGRYEVGVDSNGGAVVQQDKQVLNYITRDEAKRRAEGMYANNNIVTSRLCSSYAWDTTLKFVETKNAGYATKSEGSNYSGGLKHTGVGSTPRNNIYDMGGNVWEWTTEVYSQQGTPCVARGGYYYGSDSDFPASTRTLTSEILADDNIGLRLTLYVI